MLYLKKFVQAALLAGIVTVSLSSCGAEENTVYTNAETDCEYSTVEEPVNNVIMTISAGEYIPAVTTTAVVEETTEKHVSNSVVYEAGKNSGTGIQRTPPEGYEMPEKKKLEFETVLQRPELPTGCEVTALDQTLKYFGFDIDKVELCEKFLELDLDAFYSMDNAYVGDPYSEYGYGCNAPVIVNTADDYFNYIGSGWKAHNITGTDFDYLLYQLAEDRPVIVWVTLDLMDTDEPILQYTSRSGDDMYFTNLQHCVTIYGYDKEKKIIYTADPMKGNVEYDMEQFKRVYEQMGKQAVVIWGNQDTKGQDLSSDEEKSAYLEKMKEARLAKKSHYLSIASGNETTEAATEAPTEPPTEPPTTVPETTTVTTTVTTSTTVPVTTSAATTVTTTSTSTTASTAAATTKTTSANTETKTTSVTSSAKTTAVSTSSNTSSTTVSSTTATTAKKLFGIKIN